MVCNFTYYVLLWAYYNDLKKLLIIFLEPQNSILVFYIITYADINKSRKTELWGFLFNKLTIMISYRQAKLLLQP